MAVQTKTLNGQKISHGVVSPKNNPGGKDTIRLNPMTISTAIEPLPGWRY
jgi:hypothetical protein